jgi:hypothetical protein
MSTQLHRCDSCGGELGHFNRVFFMEEASCLACGLKHTRDVDGAQYLNAPYRSAEPIDSLMVPQTGKKDAKSTIDLFTILQADEKRRAEAASEKPSPELLSAAEELFPVSFLLVPGQVTQMIATPGWRSSPRETRRDERAFLAQGPFGPLDLDRELLRDMGFCDEPWMGCETWSFDRHIFVFFIDGSEDLTHYEINGRGLSRKDFFAWFVRELKYLARESLQ